MPRKIKIFHSHLPNSKPEFLKYKRIVFSQKDRNRVMHFFHSLYLEYGFMDVSQDAFLGAFSRQEKFVPVLESLVDKGYIFVNKEDSKNYTYRLTGAGLAYFADRQEQINLQKKGKAWEFFKLLLSALLGAIASQWISTLGSQTLLK